MLSTESTLLKIFNDILLAVDSGKVVILILLDLTTAFDTIDYGILLRRLEDIGIKGTTWFKSHLKDRLFSVCIGNLHSTSANLHCGVPQCHLGLFYFLCTCALWVIVNIILCITETRRHLVIYILQ